MHNGPFQNFLLSRLRATDLDLLRPHLQMKDLRRRQVLERPGERVMHAYFLESGLASVLAVAPDDRRIEVGMIGYEGMTAISALLGSGRAANETMVQNEGRAACIAATDLRTALMTSPPLKDALLKYVDFFIGQMSHTALATGQCNITQRTARWLLMWRDRIDSDELPVTHALLSEMLGVRRPSATVTIHELEERGLIRSTRSRITILDRNGLIALTRGCYGAPEATYDRVIGVRPYLEPGDKANDIRPPDRRARKSRGT